MFCNVTYHFRSEGNNISDLSQRRNPSSTRPTLVQNLPLNESTLEQYYCSGVKYRDAVVCDAILPAQECNFDLYLC